MAFYETFNLTIDDEIVDPSSYAQGDIQTTYAGTATTITQTHIVDGYKILIEFDDDFGDNVDLYLEGSKVISSRAVIGKDHIAEAGDLSVESIVVNVGKDYEGGFKVVSYQGDTGETIGNVASLINDDNIRYCTLAGFCNTNVGAPNYASAGVIGVGYTETTSINPAIGVRGRGVSTNVQDCAGGIFDAETATGSNTYAVYAKASGGSVANYSFYGEAGEMYNLGNVNFAAVCAADTFRLASGKYIGYSAAVGTAPTGGLSFNTSNTASFTSAIVCQSNAQITRTAGDANVTLRRVNTGATAIANGNIFATIRGQGYDGSAYVTSCEMYMDATQDHSSGKSGGRIVFQTTTNDTATATKRWVIENDGHFTPFADNTYDYGTTTLQGRDGFFAGNVNVGTLRLASGKYIGYSAAVGTAPTGGLSFGTTNNATFTGNITNNGGTLTVTKDGYTNIIARSSGGNFSQIDFEQSNGTLASRTKTLSGNTIGQLRWFGRNDTANIQCAQITAIAIGDFSATSSGSGLYFQTVANGSTSLTGRWFIAHDGHFIVSANNTYDIGTTSLKVKDYYGAGNVYAATATMGTATSYTQISAEGLKYFGDATTWDDLQFPVATGKVPAANFPDYEALTTNTQAFAFEVGEYIDLQANEPSHGWKEGTSAEFHLHIATKSAIAGESAARFEIIIAHATPTGVFIETSLSANYSFSDPLAKQHFYVDIGSLPLTGYLIGTQLLCRVKRVAETTAFSEYGDEIFITQVGAHLEYDSTGSRTESAK
jgi:hypothetical protein